MFTIFLLSDNYSAWVLLHCFSAQPLHHFLQPSPVTTSCCWSFYNPIKSAQHVAVELSNKNICFPVIYSVINSAIKHAHLISLQFNKSWVRRKNKTKQWLSEGLDWRVEQARIRQLAAEGCLQIKKPHDPHPLVLQSPWVASLSPVGLHSGINMRDYKKMQ